MILATIGYEGASSADFIATLKAANVTRLLDVRELPISRRKGFAKGALSVALEAAGIGYVHLKGLGDPKEGREAARAADTQAFVHIFTQHLTTNKARADLEHAVQLVEGGGACLMCYERDPNFCHRKLVANALSAKIGIQVQHLGVRDGIANDARWTRASAGPR